MLLFCTFVILLGLVQTEGLEICPEEDAIKPCECLPRYDGSCIMECNLVQFEDIKRIAEIPNLCNGDVHLDLVHSKIPGIPTKLWKTLLSSKTVDVSIQHSTLDAFVPKGDDPIPVSYSPGDAVIKIAHSKIGVWDWKHFKDFSPEDDFTIVIDDTPLPELTTDFARIAGGRLHKVTIDETALNSVPKKLFAEFDEIESLSLQNNNLKEFSRSLIPNPAKKLRYLSLNGNALTFLPGDLFTGMPVLEAVYLRDNQFKSVPQDLFPSVISPKLRLIDFVNNPWECDCRLMWITSKAKVHVNMGNCASPTSVSKRKVKDLPTLLDC